MIFLDFEFPKKNSESFLLLFLGIQLHRLTRWNIYKSVIGYDRKNKLKTLRPPQVDRG
jgi:hypothetical protein